MSTSLPKQVSFILHFSRSEDSRWTGRLREVERGRAQPFVCLESFVQELAVHGVALRHRKRADQICSTCRRSGGAPKEEE